ncbi:ArnT family glycosyltransferase [Patescibacteria group bacterium]
MDGISKNKAVLILLAILLLASFFRLWQLDVIPPGVYPDEAINANEAISNPGNVFYPENNGREGLYINLLSFSFSVFGISILSLKIVPAVLGILTVLGVYLLTKELFQKENLQAEAIAILSSFFLAVSFWHVNFSRIGFRAVLFVMVMTFAFAFLFKGFRKNSIVYLILSGMFFGLGFHTYISYRFIVPLIFILLASLWLVYKKQYLLKTSILLFFIFIIALPIGWYFLENPQDFMSRAGPISVFAQENPIMATAQSFVSHLAMFNISGDFNWRHNFSGSPSLLFPVGILFVIGFIFSIKKAIEFARKKECDRAIPYWFLLLWFFIMLLPGVLTFEGIPHSLRVIGAIPAAYIFSGLGGVVLYNLLSKTIKNKIFLIILCIMFFQLVAITSYNKYFCSWANDPNVQGAFTRQFVEIGYVLNSFSSEINKYVIVNEGGVRVPLPDGIPMSSQTIEFIENTRPDLPKSTYLLPEDIHNINPEKGTIIIPMKYDEGLFNEIQQKFPQGELREINNILIYEIK